MKKQRCYGCMKLTEHKICTHCGYDNSKDNGTHRLPAGTILQDQYLIGCVLGQGGFGITYFGWDLNLEIPIAVKEYYPNGMVMRDNSVSTEVQSYAGELSIRFGNNKERFLREAKMLARFSDTPEIVQIRSFFLANNTAYIVMEYVDGITLKEHIKRSGGKLGLEETFCIMEPLIAALGKVHKTGLVHRDISPDNIMMLPNGKVKLLDFGAVRDVGDAKIDKELTKSTEAILKHGYAPIEQYQNRGNLGPWTDVYALCATIYYCLTGEVPEEAPERMLGGQEFGIASKIADIREEQALILEKGLALRPAERIASMEELYCLLYPERAKELEITIPKTKMNTDKTEIVGKNRWKTVVAACMVVLFIAAGIWFALQNHGEDMISKGEDEAQNEDYVLQGECGDDIRWEMDMESGRLSLYGSGETWKYTFSEELPEDPFDPYAESDYDCIGYPEWWFYVDKVEEIYVGEGITYLSGGLFCFMENLKSVEMVSVETVEGTFNHCGLEEIVIPQTVENIGQAFYGCEDLKTIVIENGSGYVEPSLLIGPISLEAIYCGPDVQWQEWWSDVDEFEHMVGDEISSECVLYVYEGSSAEEFAIKYQLPYEIWDGRQSKK